MFEQGATRGSGAGPGDDAVPLRPEDITAMRRLLEHLDPTTEAADHPASAPRSGAPDHSGSHDGGQGLSQAQCIDLLRELEDLKSAAAGAQVVITAHLTQARHDAEEAAAVPRKHLGKGLAAEVALARRVSPHRGGQHLGLATALQADMPRTLAALRRGVLSEWRATLLVRESICLSATERQALDAQMCADPARLESWGDKRLAAETRKAAYRLDPHSVVARAARAEQERCVTVRPAPDTMAYLTALLPVSQAAAAQAALIAAAGAARNTGDDRSRGQVMADTLVSRVTGRDPAAPADVHVQLIMSDRTLLAGGTEPAEVPGHGPVPSGWARELVRRALESEGAASVRLRRLFTDTADRLVAMESANRLVPPGLAHYVATRDLGTCRSPWCDAPVRHIDHVVAHSAGGATSEENLDGLCERCNYVKNAPGWSARAVSSGDPPGGAPAEDLQAATEALSAGTIVTRTPTGHTYRSPVPKLPRAG